MTMKWMFFIAIAFAAFVFQSVAQQVPDKDFKPKIDDPLYVAGKGPIVCLDEAHFNFHTLAERFWAFGELLRRDGFVVRANLAKFDKRSLKKCRVLVISNAQPNADAWKKYPYPTPSAFTPNEIEAVHGWVRDGGRLLLIADHMPLAGAASTLAGAFGVRFLDGFAIEGFGSENERDAAFDKPTIFRKSDNTLREHEITRGRNPKEAITAIRTFTGQAFKAPPGAEILLTLPSTFVSLMPTTAWEFRADTKHISVGGWLQGAVMRVGSGRAAFFGEAAMFSAQVTGPQRRPMGMNAPGAEQNPQFVLNLIHWLSR